ncbi:MAG: dTDP-4-dehydrorhamnose 3,5-epimerase [Deltaproteobacteria bacterium]|nr:dTDP-4-dehydrorhamnose 3,5-epimerase [Deltaproteobacteria bacterium]
MGLKRVETTIPGVVLIELNIFNDSRGFFLETHHQKRYAELGIDEIFVQDNHSHSRKGTLRGLHYQLNHAQGKLIYVVRGQIYDVAVDIRRCSPTFGEWTGAVLSDQNKYQIFIPKGFAHGFYVLSETADVIYKCSDLYTPDDEYGIFWADPKINIKWPEKNPILSEKDNQYPNLENVLVEHLPFYP